MCVSTCGCVSALIHVHACIWLYMCVHACVSTHVCICVLVWMNIVQGASYVQISRNSLYSEVQITWKLQKMNSLFILIKQRQKKKKCSQVPIMMFPLWRTTSSQCALYPLCYLTLVLVGKISRCLALTLRILFNLYGSWTEGWGTCMDKNRWSLRSRTNWNSQWTRTILWSSDIWISDKLNSPSFECEPHSTEVETLENWF